MTTALDIVAQAYRQAKLDQDVTSFSTSQEFPYNISLDLLNDTIRDMNRRGNFWFTETATLLPYSVGVNTYNLNTYNVDPKRITRLRIELADNQGEIRQITFPMFQRLYRMGAVNTTKPYRFAAYGTTLYLDATPDKDYSLTLYHFQNIPLITATTDVVTINASDEDIYINGVYALLCQRLGRPDFQTTYQIWEEKATGLLANMRDNAGMANQMPANF